MNLRNYKINLSTFFSLQNRRISTEKAYTEGVYADTPANRKLGRVGMSYADWEKKQGKREEKIDNISLYRLGKVLNGEGIYPMSINDHKEYFLISLENKDFKDKKKVQKTKEVLEKLGAKVYVSKNTHFLKAYKKDNIVEEKEENFFEIGSFKFDVDTRTLIDKNGEEKSLTPKEAELLRALVSNPNQIVSRDGLLEKIWGESNYYNSRSMDVYITRLREKLSGDKNIKLMTVHWKGFKLILPNKNSKKENNKNNSSIQNIIDKTQVLKNAEGKRLDAIIEYSNSIKGVSGIKVKEGASDKEKKEAIADFYIKTAELEGKEENIANDLDEIIEDALTDYTPKESKENKEKRKGGNPVVLKKINDYFGFEDEEVSWFADTPIALTMADDKEFSEIIDKFTDYQVLSQSGSYKNNGSRATMLSCNVEYEIVPKGISDEDIKDNTKKFVIDNKTTIRDILKKLS